MTQVGRPRRSRPRHVGSTACPRARLHAWISLSGRRSRGSVAAARPRAPVLPTLPESSAWCSPVASSRFSSDGAFSRPAPDADAGGVSHPSEALIMFRTTFATVALALIALFATGCNNQMNNPVGDYGIVSGVVSSSSGPVSGAQVCIDAICQTTAADGTYKLQTVPADPPGLTETVTV